MFMKYDDSLVLWKFNTSKNPSLFDIKAPHVLKFINKQSSNDILALYLYLISYLSLSLYSS